MPDPTCPHLAPIGGWCRLGTNFKCPAKAGRADCPHPNVGSLDQRSSERASKIAAAGRGVIPFDHGRIFETLALPFALSEITWRIESLSRDRRRALVHPEVSQQIILERIDAVVGTVGWSEHYEINNESGSSVKCSLTILGITKQDLSEASDSVATSTQTRVLSQQAFVRTASKFGIGRYLEKLEDTWVDYDDASGLILETPTLPDWALPTPPQLPRLTRLNPPNTPTGETAVPFNITRTASTGNGVNALRNPVLPTADGNALLIDLMRSLRELPGGEAALRKLLRHESTQHGNLTRGLGNRNPEEKRRLYAELRRAHRELSGLQA